MSNFEIHQTYNTLIYSMNTFHIRNSGIFYTFHFGFFCHFFGALNHSSKKCMIDFFSLSRRFRISAETFQERHQCNQNLLFFFENVWIYKVAGGKMMMTFFLATLVVFLCFVSVSVSLSRPHRIMCRIMQNIFNWTTK